MTKRFFKNMDKGMPLLGFGAMRLPIIDGNGENIDLEQVKKMVDYFIENGFNYFDTAYPYHNGKSETAMKQALVERHERATFYLADKMPLWLCKSYSDYERFFNEQLERCGVDYFDFYLLHAMSKEREKACIELGAYNFLKKLKEEGKVKHIGFSFHDSPEVLKGILEAHPEMEFVQLQINYLDWEGLYAREYYKIAEEHGLPVIVMEPVKGGSLANLHPNAEKLLKEVKPNSSATSWAVRFCASLEGVMTVLSGMSNLQQLEDNVSYMKDFTPYSDIEHETIRKALREIDKLAVVPCTTCRYCIDCPQGIDIPKIFSIYNEYKRSGDKGHAGFMYETIHADKKADQCIKCRSCTEHCPQHIDIPEELKKIHPFLTSLNQ